jgi:hypothetical protein
VRGGGGGGGGGFGLGSSDVGVDLSAVGVSALLDGSRVGDVRHDVYLRGCVLVGGVEILRAESGSTFAGALASQKVSALT